MKFFGWMCIIWFVASVGTAQLVLPDFYVDEEEGDAPEPSPPAVDGPHSRGETSDETSDEASQMDQQMRQMMQAMQVRRPHTARTERLAEEDEALSRQDFKAGPAELMIELIRRDGRSVRLEVPNQTLMLSTRAGRLPVRLHEVAEMREDGEAMVIRFQDADQVTGRLERIYMPVDGEPGRFRALPLDGISLIRLSSPE
ncbi:MAG: hypothetical protein JJU05_02175 [Verrucomicrobia bacterium]|nr:hypothetical protein [Verrucomicrobiota bacterium]MCH8528110.1 hypothetical protein [Kiritimatiellia bacterium]